MTTFEMLAIMPAIDAAAPDARLHFVTAHGYTAILAHAPRRIMTKPQNRKQALSQAAARQALLEACMPYGPLLVCRPQCYVSKTDIPSLIAANSPLFDQLVMRLQGMVQYQVSVSWTPAGVLAHFRNSEELSDLFGANNVTPQALEGAVTMLARRLGKQINDTLSATSTEMLHLPLATDMLSNAVVLLASDQSDALDKAVEAIDRIWTEGFRIKQIGPAPAASFVLLDPVAVTRREIAAAFRHLGLKHPTDLHTIAQARRKTLLEAPQHAEKTRHNAAIAEAASRACPFDQPLFLCTARSEDQATPQFERKVA